MNRAKLWQQTENRRKKHFGKVRRLVREALDKQMQPVFQQLTMGIVPFVESLISQPISAAFGLVYISVGIDFAKSTYNQVRSLKDDRSERLTLYWEDYMRNYVLTQAGDKITSITDETKDMVRDVLADAAKEGWSIEKTARAMRIKWNKTARWRAILIARTEIMSASNMASYLGAQTIAQEAGLELDKVWLSKDDPRTRASHLAANGQTVPLDGLFRVNGESLRYPGDPNGSAKNVIQCRCAVGYAKRK